MKDLKDIARRNYDDYKLKGMIDDLGSICFYKEAWADDCYITQDMKKSYTVVFGHEGLDAIGSLVDAVATLESMIGVVK